MLRTFNPQPKRLTIEVWDFGGLGLAISKGIVEMHGGTIRAESEGRGKGARFTVEVPTTGRVGVGDPHLAPP